MTPDSGPDNRLPEQRDPKQPTRPYRLLVLALIALAATTGASAQIASRARYLLIPEGATCPSGYMCLTYKIQDSPDGFPPGGYVPLGPFVPAPMSTGIGDEEIELGASYADVSTQYELWACFDSSKDCGDVADRFCSGKNSWVTFQSYDPSAETPCRFTCANGEGGTCKKTPETATPKPKPGDVTTMPYVGMDAR